MIPEIKRILYTTDLSPNSAYAFRYAINSANKHDAGIIRHSFLGSAARKVLRRVRKPVFIIPLPEREEEQR